MNDGCYGCRKSNAAERYGDSGPRPRRDRRQTMRIISLELVSLANTVAPPPVTRSGPMRAQFKEKLESEPASTLIQRSSPSKSYH